MKINKKSILSAGLAIALAAAVTVGGTYAYLRSSTEDVVNNFAANQVTVSLEEKTGNDYNIIPGTEQAKDPTVKLKATVPAYVFVAVNDDTDGLVTYALADGWAALEGFPGVYYRAADASDEAQTFEVLKDNKVSYDAALENSDMLKNGALKENIALTFKAHAIQQAGFDTAAAAYVEATAVKVEDKAALKTALADAEDGAVIAIAADEPIVLDKTENIKITKDTTIVGGKIENGTLDVAIGSDVTFNGVEFAKPTNSKDNASSVYAKGCDSKVVFEGCRFVGLQWEAIQVVPVAGAEIIVNNCYFSNIKTMAESGIKQNRYLHIEVTDTTTNISGIKATVTNNIFENVVQSAEGGNGYFVDSAVTIYGVPHANMTLEGNVFCGVVADDALSNNDKYIWISDGRTWNLRYDGFSMADTVKTSEELTAAIKTAQKGDIIYLLEGEYSPAVNTDWSLETDGITLIGSGKGKTVLNDKGISVSSQAAVYVRAADISIRNMTIKTENEGQYAKTVSPLKISDDQDRAKNITIENVELIGNKGQGLNIHQADNVTLKNVDIVKYGTVGISLSAAQNISLYNTDIEKSNGTWGDIGMMYAADKPEYKTPCSLYIGEGCTFGLGWIYSEKSLEDFDQEDMDKVNSALNCYYIEEIFYSDKTVYSIK